MATGVCVRARCGPSRVKAAPGTRRSFRWRRAGRRAPSDRVPREDPPGAPPPAEPWALQVGAAVCGMPLESEESGEKRRWSNAGRFQCHEADGNNITKPINCLDSLMPWVQRQLDDQTLLPAKALWEDTKSTEVLHISTSKS